MKAVEKLLKKLPTEFIDAVDQMNTDEIKARILTCEGHLFEIQNALESNEKLLKAREEVKTLAGPYRESKSEEMGKIKYCLYVLESRGINL